MVSLQRSPLPETSTLDEFAYRQSIQRFALVIDRTAKLARLGDHLEVISLGRRSESGHGYYLYEYREGAIVRWHKQ